MRHLRLSFVNSTYWLVCGLLLALVPNAQAQSAAEKNLKPGEWRAYTSMRSVRAIAVDRDSQHVWVATDGGAYRMSINPNSLDSDLLALRTTDGLYENSLNAVGCAPNGDVYFGGANGGFDVYRTD